MVQVKTSKLAGIHLSDVTVTTRLAPTTAKAHTILADGVASDRVLSIVGRCTATYDGRTQSSLGAGERVVLCKPDGTLLVHQPTGQEPINWQPPGGTHDIALEGTTLLVRSERDTPAETVEIRFTDVLQVSTYDLTDDQELDLIGSEEDLRQRILDQPSLIEPGFQPRAIERETSAGPVDIYGIDAEGTPVIVECKRRQVGPDAVGQLARYVTAAERERTTKTVRGILVAPALTDRAKRELEQHDLTFVPLDPNNP